MRCISPTVEAGNTPIREAGRKPANVLSPTGCVREQAAKGSQSERTLRFLVRAQANARISHRHACTGESGSVVQQKLTRRRRPKTGKVVGPTDVVLIGRSPTNNPVDSATLRLRKTSIRNVVTTPVLSVWSMAEQGDVPNRMHGEWWDGPRSKGPG